MPQSIVFKIALMILAASLPHLKKMAEGSDNPWDDVGVQILEVLVGAFKSGELRIG